MWIMLLSMAVRTAHGIISAWHFEGTDTVGVRYFDRVESLDGSAQWSDVETMYLSNFPEHTFYGWVMNQWQFDAAWVGIPIPRKELAKV